MVNEVLGFFEERIDMLYQHKPLRALIISLKDNVKNNYDSAEGEEQIFRRVFNLYVEECKLTLSIIEPHLKDKTVPILELGGGVGLTYAFLKSKGYNIYGVEPSASGFNDYYHAAVLIFEALGCKDDNWYNLMGNDLEQIGVKFDLVFSNNVLEHITDLEPVFKSIKNVLLPGGLTIHNTVNYNIPYEPHFKTSLVPFFPKLTSIFRPWLNQYEVWCGLNFVTPGLIRSLCSKIELKAKFRTDTLYNTLCRLDTDAEFANRQKGFVSIFKFLKKTRLLPLLKNLPSAFVTPMLFEFRLEGAGGKY